MNFLFLNSAKQWGGNEKWSYLAAKSLSENHHNVYLACRHQIIGQRFPLVTYCLPFWSEFDLFTLSQLISIIKKHGIDIIIPTKRKDYVLGGISARICGIRNILRLGICRDLHGSWINNLVYNKWCDGIIVNAHFIKKVLLRSPYICSEKVRVIYNGVDLPAVTKKAKEKGAFRFSFPFVIATMGEISPRKGYDLLLRGFAHFIKDGLTSDGCGLVIIGGGQGLVKLRELARQLQIEQNVVFTGYQRNPYPYLKRSDLFVMTSHNEGIPNALLEAMVLKKAVITTDVGGIREIIRNGENGYILSERDSHRLAKTLSLLYRDQQKRRQIAQAGYMAVIQHFSLERMTTQLSQFFSEIVRQS